MWLIRYIIAASKGSDLCFLEAPYCKSSDANKAEILFNDNERYDLYDGTDLVIHIWCVLRHHESANNHTSCGRILNGTQHIVFQAL